MNSPRKRAPQGALEENQQDQQDHEKHEETAAMVARKDDGDECTDVDSSGSELWRALVGRNVRGRTKAGES